ncbi:hypothetical protein MNEG_11746 [Monoraphidium neglectum]|uniref:Uncharacterized protein n=1 Tax=Monoraphidium neglectum TaxID=145388 RepID=A0A0D2KKA8_9CHLO|nr:hypothetical protein MNEG_11746 [Monoraphidium neglectum]KIY96218.1 hypothetical protein MNEG_11746 [Monoraphidium neglectum]|eukprot:XP_013895238.1 hypothetical protein MNEG_11746 [Monoraphidium neglectum]
MATKRAFDVVLAATKSGPAGESFSYLLSRYTEGQQQQQQRERQQGAATAPISAQQQQRQQQDEAQAAPAPPRKQQGEAGARQRQQAASCALHEAQQPGTDGGDARGRAATGAAADAPQLMAVDVM